MILGLQHVATRETSLNDQLHNPPSSLLKLSRVVDGTVTVSVFICGSGDMFVVYLDHILPGHSTLYNIDIKNVSECHLLYT